MCFWGVDVCFLFSFVIFFLCMGLVVVVGVVVVVCVVIRAIGCGGCFGGSEYVVFWFRVLFSCVWGLFWW